MTAYITRVDDGVVLSLCWSAASDGGLRETAGLGLSFGSVLLLSGLC